MVTVSHLVKKVVEDRPFLEEALARGIVNYAALANSLKPEIDAELEKDTGQSAIMMALRRLAESLNSEAGLAKIRFSESDITIKSDLFELTVLKSQSIINHIRKLYDIVDFSRGDLLTITHGIYEITIISNRKYKDRMLGILKGEDIVKMIDGLSSLTIKIPIEAVETMGFFYVVTKALNWDNINIVEIVSTLTEMTFILRERDVPRAFSTIKTLI